MRIRTKIVATLFLALPLVGCGLVYGLGDYRIEDVPAGDGGPDAPVEAAEAAPSCTTNAECTTRATAEGPVDAGADFDGGPVGVLEGGTAPAVCVKPEGVCVRLLTRDCPTVLGDYANDDAILLGTLFTLSGATTATNLPRQLSALLAAEEINSSLGGSGIPPAKGTTTARPLVVLSCDESQNLVRVGTHLVKDLHVAGIVGPNTSQDTLDITTKLLSSSDTLIMSPTAVAAGIAGLADTNLTWRDIPSDTPRAKLMMQQINALETGLHAGNLPGQPMPAVPRAGNLKLGIVYRDDAQGQSNFGAISGELQWNGAGLAAAANAAFVKISRYNPTNAAADTAAIVTDYLAARPDVIGVFGTAESLTGFLIPYEKALEAASPGGAKPYYMLIDSNKITQLLDGTIAPGVPPSLRIRLRGVGVTSEDAAVPVLNAFNGAYTARYGTNPRVSGMGQSYDAMYALALALAATTEERPSGTSIARGLTKLGTGQSVLLGQGNVRTAFQQLALGNSITATGTFSQFKWDKNGDLAGGIMEIWCMSAGTPNFFASSGLTMDVATLTPSGAYTACP
jgi:ABC-type branched-subunit amino acid transport system substrate-binding protein